ncbi:MAG: PD40 domain-containing protein, partial [Planctomycetes bacterium]|nr:PD40 domain-containing protein [Planctomycetota bacterium]
NNAGDPGNKQSFGASVSNDGRYVSFISDATNLVEGDTNDKQDVFVRDRKNGTTVRISVSNFGEQANEDCHEAVISSDGRILAFTSAATTLDENINNRSADIFLCDREAKFVRRITRSAEGFETDHGSGEPAISANGRFVAFYSHATNIAAKDTNGRPDIYLFDAQNSTTELISVASNRMIGNRDSRRPQVSEEGRYVVFESWATNLVSGDKNDGPDVFLRDRESKKTICVSTDADGKTGNDDSREPKISDDGNFVVFTSFASNLVAGDTNNFPDIFVYDRKTRKTERVNLTTKGEQAAGRSGEGTLSGDGRWVAFASKASNIVEYDTNQSRDIFVVDRATKKILRISDPKTRKKSP